MAIVFQKKDPIINSEASLSSLYLSDNPTANYSNARQALGSDALRNSENADESSTSEVMIDTPEVLTDVPEVLTDTPREDTLSEYPDESEKPKPEKIFATNDTFFPLQHYLEALHIPAAWDKVDKNNTAIVAVIDDGVNINHPDLTDSIWVHQDSSYGSNKIKDFAEDDVPNNFPTGRHGTMVAGIIWATTGNKEGIAGIAKHVKIMPLRVFDYRGNARESAVINAMYYAINNKADIINLSLGQSQFSYSRQYDKVMQLAYENGIIVIIASGNWDTLSLKGSGVNTSVNPVSPVCNNNGVNKYSLGVWSLNDAWVRARWSNYGSCVSFFTPGENIFSTSIAVFSKEYWVDYDTDSGSSFSAPMISGIVALGFNQFWRVSPDIVRESLNESLRKNKSGEYLVDASVYLDTLEQKKDAIGKQQSIFQQKQKNTEKNSTQKDTLSKLSNHEYLAALGYIESKNSTNAYKISEPLSRIEMTELALRVANVQIPESYTCRWVFVDVSALKPDSRSCSRVEFALKKGIITQEGSAYFRPLDNISLVEAVSMLLRASNTKIQQHSGGDFEPWQTNVIGTAFSLWLVKSSFDFSPSKIAIRRDVFAITRRIIEDES